MPGERAKCLGISKSQLNVDCFVCRQTHCRHGRYRLAALYNTIDAMGKEQPEWDILRAKLCDEVEKRSLLKSAIGLNGNPPIYIADPTKYTRRCMAGARWFPLSPVVEVIGLSGKLEKQL